MSAFLTGKSLDGVLELTRELGGDPTALVYNSGLSEDAITKQDELIHYSVCAALVENAARLVRDPAFGIKLAQRRLKSDYARELKIYATSAKTLRQAFRDLIVHLRTRSLGIDYHLETAKGSSSFSRTLPPRETMASPQVTMIVLTLMYLILSEATQYRLNLSSVTLTFRDPGCRSDLESIFRCPIQFDAELDAINFPTTVLDSPIVTQNDSIHDLLAGFLEARHLQQTQDFAELTKTLIGKNLIAGRSDIDALALRMPFQVRTIQKKLEILGTSYRDLLRETRFELAEALLSGSDTPVTYIAQRLCYQDVSAFSKAFQNHYGKSPRQWRNESRLQRANDI